MNQIQQLITDHFNLWTSSENEKKTGVGRSSSNNKKIYGIQKLRQLILNHAFQGTLIPSNSDENPSIEKTNVTQEQMPFKLPQNWRWVYLPEIANYNIGKTPSTKNSSYWSSSENGCNWVSIADLNDRGVVSTTSKNVTLLAQKEVFKSDPIKAGSILMSFKLTIGKISMLEIPAYHNEAILSIFPSKHVNKEFLFKVLPSRALAGNSKGAIKGNTLNSKSIATLLIPLPPLNEQARIVNKIDEFMALCDNLEQKETNSKEAHEKLVKVLLDTLTQSKDEKELNENWQRIADLFDTLFTTEDSIDELKKTLLQLAVMGKLVPQDPNDEPASELIKKNQKEKLIEIVNQDDKQFDIPASWEWTFLGSHSVIERGGSPRPIKDFLTNDPSGFNWIKIGDTVPNSKYISTTREKIKKEGLKKTRMVYPGDFLLTNSMSFGKPFISNIKGCIHDGWLKIQPNSVMNKDYLYQLLTSPFIYKSFIKSAAGAVVQNLNAEKVRKLLIPVPPFAEQIRIVTKLEELMILCDELKSLVQQAREKQKKIADVLVLNALN